MKVCDSMWKKTKTFCSECGAITRHKAMKHFQGTRVSMHTNHKRTRWVDVDKTAHIHHLRTT